VSQAANLLGPRRSVLFTLAVIDASSRPADFPLIDWQAVVVATTTRSSASGIPMIVTQRITTAIAPATTRVTIPTGTASTSPAQAKRP